jgi:AcrR family transcriptional regulator
VSAVPAVDAPHRPADSAGDTTVDRLLDAAERLVADRGLAGTSVRAICAEADANVAAVHYHFGSKDALVDAVLERRMTDLTTRRFELLEPLEGQAQPAVHDVVDVLVRPLAEFARDPKDSGRSYVRFLAALNAAGELDRIGVAFTPQYERLEPLFARALPGVSRALVAFRLDLVSNPLFVTLADPDHALRHWHGTPRPSYDERVDELVDTITGTLRGGSA